VDDFFFVFNTCQRYTPTLTETVKTGENSPGWKKFSRLSGLISLKTPANEEVLLVCKILQARTKAAGRHFQDAVGTVMGITTFKGTDI